MTSLRGTSTSMEEDSHSFPLPLEHQKSEPQNYSKFNKSLQELKDLCSQLHAAAGYSETTFLNSNHKHLVVESTKEYVCRAVVAVVDHFGSVSANLDDHISETAESDIISQTELRIDHLNKKLFICQEYSDKLALAKLTWGVNMPRYNSRYLKPPVPDSIQTPESEIVANTVNNEHECNVDEKVPLFLYPCIYKTPDSSSLSALSIHDSFSNQPKPRSFSLQVEKKHASARSKFFRKSMTSNNILSIIRRRK